MCSLVPPSFSPRKIRVSFVSITSISRMQWFSRSEFWFEGTLPLKATPLCLTPTFLLVFLGLPSAMPPQGLWALHNVQVGQTASAKQTKQRNSACNYLPLSKRRLKEEVRVKEREQKAEFGQKKKSLVHTHESL